MVQTLVSWYRSGRAELAALLWGASLVLAFAPFGAWYWAPFPLAAYFVLTSSPGVFRAARLGAFFGIGFFGVGLAWIVESFQFNSVPFFVAVIVTMGLVVVLSAYPAALGAVHARLHGVRTSGFCYVVSLASGWVLVEWARGTLFTGFPWLTVGIGQVEGPLAGWLPLAGALGASFVVAIAAAAIAGWWRARTVATTFSLFGTLGWVIVASLMLHGQSWSDESEKSLSVALIQGNVPQDEKWIPANRAPTLAKYLALTRLHWDADLVVWPETAVPGFPSKLRPFLRSLDVEARRKETELLIGIPSRDSRSGLSLNTVMKLGGADSGVFYAKRRLVPFGEYLPFAQMLERPLRAMGLMFSDFQAGAFAQPTLRVKGSAIGISICYEVAFSGEIGRSLPDAELLVNVSNDAWFGDTFGPQQHLQIAQARAREAGRWLLRATNTGLTAAIDPQGGVHAELPQFQAGALRADVTLRSGLTPYYRAGDSWLAVGLAIIWLLVNIHRAPIWKRVG